MKTEIVTSTPLKPIAQRMRDLTAKCSDLWVASAFLSRAAIADAFDAAASDKSAIRILTGTFGNSTRKATFKWLLNRVKPTERHAARIWHNGIHGDFHGKLYLWRRRDGSATVWIGSANFTDGGLQNDGELLLQIKSTWASTIIRRLARAFEREWERATPLTDIFVKNYREADRRAPGQAAVKAKKRVSPSSDSLPSVFVISISHHFSDSSAVAKRVERLLGPKLFVRHHSTSLKQAGSGDLCFLVDTLDNEIELVRVTDSIPDGNAGVFSYEKFFKSRGAQKWRPLRSRLAALGLATTKNGLRTQWLDMALFNRVTGIVYPNRTISL